VVFRHLAAKLTTGVIPALVFVDKADELLLPRQGEVRQRSAPHPEAGNAVFDPDVLESVR
jgi:hypothetical protein